MALCLLLENSKNVQILQAAFNKLRIWNSFLKNETEEVDHVPNQLWWLKNIEHGHKFATDKLEQLSVIDLWVDELTVRYLLFLTLCKAVIAAT